MATIPGQRYQSGDRCMETGWYEFDGYLDGPTELLPAIDEMQIPLLAGQPFPPIRSRRRECFWMVAEEIPIVGDPRLFAPVAPRTNFFR